MIEMPVKKVTSVMFGGPKLDILYVTSMAKPPLPRFPGDGVAAGQPLRHQRPRCFRSSGATLRSVTGRRDAHAAGSEARQIVFDRGTGGHA